MRRAELLLIPLAFAAAFGLSRVFRGHSSRGGEVPAAARPLPLEARASESTRSEAEDPAIAGAQALEAAARRGSDASPAPATAGAREDLARAALAKGEPGPAEQLLAQDVEGCRRPTRISLAQDLALLHRERGDLPAAANVLVHQIEAMSRVRAPYGELRPVADRLDALNREFLFHPAGTWRSEPVVVVKGDSWHGLAKKYAAAKRVAHGIGLLRAVNRRSGDLLVPGERLRVPLDPIRIAVYRDSFALLVYLGDLVIRVYPVGVGREDAETPTGKFVIGRKDPKPVWWKPHPPLPAGDPRNPLGARWIGFRLEGRDIPYGIHGTESEDAVGARVSEGCLRLHNPDVIELYDLLPDSGTLVEVF